MKNGSVPWADPFSGEDLIQDNAHQQDYGV